MIEGTFRPLFVLQIRMITSKQILELVEEKLSGSASYIVDVNVKAGNKIIVSIDNNNGISIGECAEVSRHITGNLDREVEDFELQVSSPGIDQPFKILQQYLKHLDKQVQVLTKEGKKHVGKLISADEQGIVIEEKYQEKIKANKAKQLIINNLHLTFDKIKETKIVLLFK